MLRALNLFLDFVFSLSHSRNKNSKKIAENILWQKQMKNMDLLNQK